MSWFSTVILAVILLWKEWLRFKQDKRNEDREVRREDKLMEMNEIYFSRTYGLLKDEPERMKAPGGPMTLTIPSDNGAFRRTDALEAQIADEFARHSDEDGA